jgi:hypothetical protein
LTGHELNVDAVALKGGGNGGDVEGRYFAASGPVFGKVAARRTGKNIYWGYHSLHYKQKIAEKLTERVGF